MAFTVHKLITPYNFTPGNNPQFLRIHDVGTVSSARNNALYFSGGFRGASAHWFVDDIEAWQVVEEYNSSWDVGDGFVNGRWVSPYTNFNGISIEICLDAEGHISDAAFENAIALAKIIMARRGITPDRVVRHFDASGKRCPGAMAANNWAKWHEFKRRISTTEVPKPSKVHFGSVDKYAVGSRQIEITGWFLSTDSINEVYPYILFMDGNGKEITRLKAERVLRPDLGAHFPKTANWHKSGFHIKTITPDILKGKGFRMLARMAKKESGEDILYEFYLDGVYSATSKLTTGNIDSVDTNGGEFKAKGWHFGDNIYAGLHRWAFLLDADTRKELARVPIKSVRRQDVQNVYPQYYMADQSGFDVRFQVPELRGIEVMLLTRYSADEAGNKTVNEHLFNKRFRL